MFTFATNSPIFSDRHTWTGFTWQAFSGLSDFLKLSAASAVMLCLETWYFQVLVLIAGLLPNPELALDSLSVCMTIAGWVFMISVGFNAAASVRVSNELGAGNPKSAFFSVLVVTVLCGIITVILAIMILCLCNYISYLFTECEIVSNAVADLFPLLAVTLILTGIQPVLSGCCRYGASQMSGIAVGWQHGSSVGRGTMLQRRSGQGMSRHPLAALTYTETRGCKVVVQKAREALTYVVTRGCKAVVQKARSASAHMNTLDLL